MKDTDLFDAIAHIDEDLIDRCLAEDDANRGIGQELSSEPAVTVTEIKPGSVGKRIAVTVASIAAALLLAFGLISVLHIGGKKPVEPVNDPTDPPVTTEAVPTEAVPGPAADADILREFFERKDAAGVKNGDKLFPNYDPADPATWIDEGDEHHKTLEFNSDGQLTSAYLSCADYASMMLAGDLDLDRFEALDSFFAVNLGIDGKVNAENVPKAATNEFLALHVERSEGISVYRGCYLEDLLLRSALRTSVEMSNPLGTDPDYLSPALRIEVVTAGSGYAGVNGWSNEDFYEVHLSAEPKAGAQFLGWYEDGRLVSTEPDYALISEAPESSLAGETAEYRFIAKFSSSISSEEAEILREFFEQEDERLGEKNGLKLFGENYDPDDPSTWVWTGNGNCVFKFDESGRLTFVNAEGYELSAPVLVGDLELDKFDSLTSFSITDYIIDGSIYANGMKTAATLELRQLNANMVNGPAVFSGGYCERIRLLSKTSTVVNMTNVFEEQTWLHPAFKVTVNTEGAGYAGVNAWDDENAYEVRLEARADEGKRFLGWYDENGVLVSTDLSYELYGEDSGRHCEGANEEFTFTAKFDPEPGFVPESYDQHDLSVLREFFATPVGENGRDIGYECFHNSHAEVPYSIDDPSTWRDDPYYGVDWNASGKVGKITLYPSSALHAELDLTGFEELHHVELIYTALDKITVADCPLLTDGCMLYLGTAYGDAHVEAGYVEKLNVGSCTSVYCSLLDDNGRPFTAELKVEGPGVVTAHSSVDNLGRYGFSIGARPDEYVDFLGWYDENGRLVSTDRSICLNGKDRSEPLRSSYKYTAKFAKPAAPTPLPEGDFFCEIIPNVPSHIDIDGDGREDTVLFNMFTDEYNDQDLDVLITLASDPDNTYTFKTYGAARGNVCGGAVDFDPTDGHIEIVVNYDECDGDPMTYVYRLRDDGSGFDTFVDYVFIEWLTEDRIWSWGYYGIPEGWAFDAKEGLGFSKRTEILGTCFVFNHFTVTENGIEYLDDEFLYPSFEYIVGSQYTLLRELTVTLENGKTKTLKKGDKISPYSTDRQTYVCVKLEDGRIGRIEVTFGDPEYQFPVLLNGINQDAYMEINYAD